MDKSIKAGVNIVRVTMKSKNACPRVTRNSSKYPFYNILGR